jgi:hypothetical protein
MALAPTHTHPLPAPKERGGKGKKNMPQSTVRLQYTALGADWGRLGLLSRAIPRGTGARQPLKQRIGSFLQHLGPYGVGFRYAFSNHPPRKGVPGTYFRHLGLIWVLFQCCLFEPPSRGMGTRNPMVQRLDRYAQHVRPIWDQFREMQPSQGFGLSVKHVRERCIAIIITIIIPNTLTF